LIQSRKGRDAIELLRSRDLRLTPQRFAVLEYVAGHAVHATAEEIYNGINRSDPRASRATVYNSLRALAAAGLVREVRIDGRSARFDANMQSHHHFVCNTCGRVEDVGSFGALNAADIPGLRGRAVSGYEIIFRGLCPVCSGQEDHRNG
jgi:Fur family peroxide stress response transcriptional regulator